MSPSNLTAQQSGQDGDGGGAGGHAAVGSSTLGVLSNNDLEAVVHDILGSLRISPRPRRFEMDDMVEVDGNSIAVLKASPVWKAFLPHIERIVEAERTFTATKAGFAARTFKQRPGVVYAVR